MPPVPPKGVGEIAIRVADMAAMVAFYSDIIGLEIMAGGPNADITFFRLGEGVAGHTDILALFSHKLGRPGVHPASDTPPATGAGSSLHHIALSMPYDDQEKAIAWYEEIEQPYRIEHFDWVGWRGLFTTDPEGNTVELVAYHEDLLD